MLRPSNIVRLLQQDRQLISDDDIAACRNSYNTWAYVGDIDNRPQLNCVYQSDDAQNEFLSNPKVPFVIELLAINYCVYMMHTDRSW